MTAQFFYRDGTPVPAEKLEIDVEFNKKGDTATIHAMEPCHRCGGAGGSPAWAFTGYKCYRCGGYSSRHFEHVKYKAYTAEKLAKLNATADKKAAKKQAEAKAKKDAAKKQFIAWAKAGGYGPLLGKILIEDRKGKYNEFFDSLAQRIEAKCPLSDKQLAAAQKVFDQREEQAAANAASQYVGNIQDRIEFEATLEFEKIFNGYYGASHLLKFRDDAGNVLVWFKSGVSTLNKGDRAKIKGTVKKHEEYQGVKQTMLSRCKIEKFEDEEKEAA